MSTDLLKAWVRDFNGKDGIGVALYALTEGSVEPLKLDVEASVQEVLAKQFLDSLAAIVLDPDANVLELSSADDRKNAIYRYDLELPEALTVLTKVVETDGLPVFKFGEQSQLSDIRVILVELGNEEQQVVLYKLMPSVNIFRPASQLFLFKSNQRLQRIEDEFLRLSPNFQLFQIGSDLYVLDLKVLERKFGFRDIIIRRAETGLNAIGELDVVDSLDHLAKLLNEDIAFARKLTRIASDSPIIKQRISQESILAFCREFPEIKKRKLVNSNGRLELTTKVSMNLFLQLMMDDLLTSELTKSHYAALAKDPL